MLLAATLWPPVYCRPPPWKYQSCFPQTWSITSSVMITSNWSHYMRRGINPMTMPDCLPLAHSICYPPNTPITNTFKHSIISILHRPIEFDLSQWIQQLWPPSRAEQGDLQMDSMIPNHFISLCQACPLILDTILRFVIPSSLDMAPSPYFGDTVLDLHTHHELRELQPRPLLPSTWSPRCLQATKPPFDSQFIAALRSQFGRDPAATVPIILDTGCSFAITFSKDDFVGVPLYKDWGHITTANGTAAITALGLVEWTVMLSDGTSFPLQVPCYLVPACTHRLLSPQDYCRYHHLPSSTDQFGGDSATMWLRLKDAPAPLRCPLDPHTHLPVFLAAPPAPPAVSPSCDCASCPSCLHHGLFNVLGPNNANLTGAQKALLFDHQRYGHVSMAHIQRLYSPCPLDRNISTATASTSCLRPTVRAASACPPPLCRACQIAKSRRQPTHARHTVDDPARRHIISTNRLTPGSLVSVDHYESSVRGRLPNTRGREKEHRQYVGGTIFFDHASSRISVHHQSTLGSSDTIRSKRKYEQECRSYGVEIQQYHTDNGIFTADTFLHELEQTHQVIEVSGVGAHHQNPYAERAIQTVVYMARAMLIHSRLCWPNEFDIKLWPFALEYACWLHNHLPDKNTGISPEEVFAGTRLNCSYLRRARVWGCPAYVLHPKLQDGRKIPKWEPRARLGQFVGLSPMHSSSVKLIRNIETDFISPQFHVVYDERFTTVESTQRVDLHETWIDLFTTAREHVFDEMEDDHLGLPDLHRDYLPEDEPPVPRIHDPTIAPVPRIHDPTIPQQGEPPRFDEPRPPNTPAQQGEATPGNDDAGFEPHPNDDDTSDSDTIYEETQNTTTHEQNDEDGNVVDHRRPVRDRRSNPRYIGPDWVNIASRSFMAIRRKLDATVISLMSIDWAQQPLDPLALMFWYMNRNSSDPDSGEASYHHPLALAARAGDVDTPTLGDILHHSTEHEREDWFKAMDTELQELVNKGTFEVVDRLAAGKHEIVPSTWAFKRKRKPDGTITRLKARFCVRGDRQLETGRTMAETFSPVVDWGTLRMLFALTVQFDFYSQQIDFKNAFVQSHLPEPIYLELPPGGYKRNPKLENKILKVYKSLYGDRRAPKLWFDHCRRVLTSDKYGFQTIDHLDPCLFLRPGCAIVLYVDDAIIVGQSKAIVDSVISQLEKDNLDLTREGDIAAYLGVQVTKDVTSGGLTLTQPHLTNRIVEALGLSESRFKDTPATASLGKCSTSPKASGLFNFRSVIGMLMYLGNNTRPDCSFAIHQCARFCADPRIPHEQAVKRIGRYLAGTKDRGLHISKSTHFEVDCFVDASFAGDWGTLPPDDPSCAKSRSGYVITVGDNPVVWASKMQTEIALSTMEAEYIALSTAMRALLPLRRIHQAFSLAFDLKPSDRSGISIVWEDNQAAKILASNDPPRMTPRSKHIAIKYHWFRGHLEPGKIEIKYISTELQKADILTKPLAKLKHSEARRLLMGW